MFHRGPQCMKEGKHCFPYWEALEGKEWAGPCGSTELHIHIWRQRGEPTGGWRHFPTTEQAWKPDFHPPRSVSLEHRLLGLYRKWHIGKSKSRAGPGYGGFVFLLSFLHISLESWAWHYMPSVPALGRPRQHSEFKDSLSCIGRPCLKK